MRESCDAVVAGNHDLGCAGLLALSRFNTWGAAAVEWTIRNLGDDEVSWLAGLPLALVTHGFGFCHAHPVRPDSWEYILKTADARDVLTATAGGTWFFGHTHSPCAWGRGGVRTTRETISLDDFPLVNCGSVGQPRDGDPRAAYTIVDTVALTARTIRVEYPVEMTSGEITASGLPAFLAERLFTGR